MYSDHVDRKRNARIDGILDRAAALVVESGLEALTLQRLASELGMATSALYRYFPGKTDILVELQIRAVAALAEEIGGAIDRASRAGAGGRSAASVALSAAWAALDVFLDGPRRSPARHRLIDAFLSAPEAQLDATALGAVEGALGPLLARVAGCLDRAAELGALAPGDGALRTRLAWAAIHGLHHLARRDRIEPRARRSPALGRAMIETLFLGWGADPAVVREARPRRRSVRR